MEDPRHTGRPVGGGKQVHRQRGETFAGKAPCDVADIVIEPQDFVNHHHAGKRSGAIRAGKISLHLTVRRSRPGHVHILRMDFRSSVHPWPKFLLSELTLSIRNTQDDPASSVSGLAQLVSLAGFGKREYHADHRPDLLRLEQLRDRF